MVRKSVAEILEKHVTFELECIDRVYLNAYVPSVQDGGSFVWFLKTQLGCHVPSTVMIVPQSRAFAEAFERFAHEQGVDLVTFAKGERKDDVLQRYLAAFTGHEGVLFVGKAQEKASVFRTEKRTDAQGRKYPWIIRSTAMVTHYYVYILDRDFGPLCLKFCTYVPYPAKLCLNGHEWLKRQLTRKRISRDRPSCCRSTSWPTSSTSISERCRPPSEPADSTHTSRRGRCSVDPSDSPRERPANGSSPRITDGSPDSERARLPFRPSRLTTISS